MPQHVTGSAEVAENFVKAAIDSAPYAGTFFYNLEKMPRHEIARREELFLPLFEQCPGFACQPEARLNTGELTLRACYYFGLCWSPDMLEKVVIPYLREYFHEVEFLSPTCQSSLEQQRGAAIKVLSQIAPAMDRETAEPVFNQIFNFLLSQEKVPVPSLLALAQFGEAIVAYDRQFDGPSDEGHPACIIVAAVVQSIETLKVALSEHAGFSPRQYIQDSRSAREACRALTVLGSIADDIMDLPDMRKDMEQIVSDSQWLITVLDRAVARGNMEFNCAEESRRTVSALRVALACLAESHPDLQQVVRDYPVAPNMEGDVFGSLLLKRAFSTLSDEEEAKIIGIVEHTLNCIAPKSPFGANREEAEKVTSAVWRLGLADEDFVEHALRGRCEPSTQAYLYRALLP